MRNYIWGFHCRVTPEGFAQLSNRFTFQFRGQPDLVKISPHYDAVSMMATFEVVSESPINIDSIGFMRKYLDEKIAGYVTFSNLDKEKAPHRAIFLGLKLSDKYNPFITRTLIDTWGNGHILHGSVNDRGNSVFVISVVATDFLPDQLIKHLEGLTEDGTLLYRNLIK